MGIESLLLIIDVQNDFCPGGTLAVKDGNMIIPPINKIINKFCTVVATQDWHPSTHVSFAANHADKKPFETVKLGNIVQELWPIHCVQGTAGAEFHPDLNTKPVNLIVRKGTNPNIDSYSAFMENDKRTKTGLQYYLTGLNVKTVYLCGLATDYCVYYSAMDALRLGFKVHVILDATRAVDMPPGNLDKTITTMKNKGIKIINHDSV